ncbi:heme-binding protein [Novosphingobium sp. ERN07]|uniref:GlcG/HbpS family heme-binding protein n=1 Tax=Novosphingobium sp. ERN07 TaxID=2726187 RepID=UPI0014566551|nr:heme-binding protein [Novosphingobium sp. ERN07]NLR70553.1 heme-binding protein [Novosphingobium sp. ERN07]
MSLTLSAAQTITSAALAEARARGAKPLAVIVLDAGGHPVAFAREDGATMFRHDIARAKAVGALGMGDDTRVIAERAKGNPAFFQSVTAVVGGNIAFSPGGVLIRDGAAVIGAVGISGDTGDCDEECALAGLRAAGFNLENAK